LNQARQVEACGPKVADPNPGGAEHILWGGAAWYWALSGAITSRRLLVGWRSAGPWSHSQSACPRTHWD